MASIDLGEPSDFTSSPVKKDAVKKKYYPTLFIRGTSLPMGEIEFSAKGKVVSVSDKDKPSCEIEIYSIEAEAIGEEDAEKDVSPEDGLDAAITEAENAKEDKAEGGVE